MQTFLFLVFSVIFFCITIAALQAGAVVASMFAIAGTVVSVTMWYLLGKSPHKYAK